MLEHQYHGDLALIAAPAKRHSPSGLLALGARAPGLHGVADYRADRPRSTGTAAGTADESPGATPA
eukprot:5795889-Alexandrium_andersonii.AAC.1